MEALEEFYRAEYREVYSAKMRVSESGGESATASLWPDGASRDQSHLGGQAENI